MSYDVTRASSHCRLAYRKDEIFLGSEACEAAASINRNLFIIIINGVTSMVTLLGLSLCIFISVRVFRHQIFHINQRILLVLIGTLLSVRATFSLYKGGWFLQRLLYITEDCEFVWHTRYCWDVIAVISEPAYAVGYCYLAIAIERVVACIFGVRYENKPWPLLSAIAVGAIVVNTAYIFACHHFPSGFFHPPPLTVNSTFVVFCTSVSYPQIRWVDLLYKFRQFPVMIFSMLIFTPVFIWTKHKNRLRVTDSTHSLDDRFHRRMTLKASGISGISARIVYPNMICFTVLYTVCCSCTTLTAYLQTDGHQVELAVIIKEFGSLAFNVHIIAHPLILIWKEPTLWKNEQRIIEDPALALDAAKHFNIVQNAWNQVQFETTPGITENKRRPWRGLGRRIFLIFSSGIVAYPSTFRNTCDRKPETQESC